MTDRFDVAHGWLAEEAAVFAIELAGAFVADFEGRAGGVEAVVDHALAGNVETQLLLILKRAHGGERAEVVVEGREGGAIYTRQEDGTDCPWGSVKVWDPPRRFVMWWQVTPEWAYETDLAKCSEVELTFTPKDDGTTLVELEHRNFERHVGDYADMQNKVSQEGGWGALMQLYAERVEKEAA